MPLEQRVIQPIYVSRGCFNHQGQVANNIPNELECVTNGTLSNIIRQLSSLSKHAENLFGCLLDDMGVMLQRSVRLQTRIDLLVQHVEQLDVADVTGGVAGTAGHHQRRPPVVARVEQFDQQVVARATIPDSLREVYESCDPPPALDKLNPFRDDNINGLKLYTNPNYFFELWRKEMLQENKTKTKIAKNRQGDNMQNAALPSGKSKRNRQRSLQHQSSSETSYSQQLTVHEQYQQQQQQPPYHSQGYYPPPQSAAAGIHSQVEILTAKATIANPNPQHGPPYTVIEGSYIDPNNYQHHYVQHQYNDGKPYGQRPNSLELQQQQQQQQNYQYYGGYAPGSSQRVPPAPPAASNQYQAAAQQSPGAMAMTPTRRMQVSGNGGLSRPSAPPPAPPGSAGNSAPNSMPGTPMHKKMNGQEVELRDVPPNRSAASRDSLPPPPPPPPNAINGAMSAAAPIAGNHEQDVTDSMLPPPPPPPPPPPTGALSFNGNQNTNLTSPPPPPPPPTAATGNGQIPANNQQQQPAYKPSAGSVLTAEELQSVKLKKIDPAAVQQSQHDPQDDVRSNLLAAIRHGIKLKRVEESRQREVEQNAPLRDVASILARRVALELSDSDGDGADDGADDDDSDAWDDESEC